MQARWRFINIKLMQAHYEAELIQLSRESFQGEHVIISGLRTQKTFQTRNKKWIKQNWTRDTWFSDTVGIQDLMGIKMGLVED